MVELENPKVNLYGQPWMGVRSFSLWSGETTESNCDCCTVVAATTGDVVVVTICVCAVAVEVVGVDGLHGNGM